MPLPLYVIAAAAVEKKAAEEDADKIAINAAEEMESNGVGQALAENSCRYEATVAIVSPPCSYNYIEDSAKMEMNPRQKSGVTTMKKNPSREEYSDKSGEVGAVEHKKTGRDDQSAVKYKEADQDDWTAAKIRATEEVIEKAAAVKETFERVTEEAAAKKIKELAANKEAEERAVKEATAAKSEAVAAAATKKDHELVSKIKDSDTAEVINSRSNEKAIDNIKDQVEALNKDVDGLVEKIVNIDKYERKTDVPEATNGEKNDEPAKKAQAEPKVPVDNPKGREGIVVRLDIPNERSKVREMSDSGSSSNDNDNDMFADVFNGAQSVESLDDILAKAAMPNTSATTDNNSDVEVVEANRKVSVESKKIDENIAETQDIDKSVKSSDHLFMKIAGKWADDAEESPVKISVQNENYDQTQYQFGVALVIRTDIGRSENFAMVAVNVNSTHCVVPSQLDGKGSFNGVDHLLEGERHLLVQDFPSNADRLAQAYQFPAAKYRLMFPERVAHYVTEVQYQLKVALTYHGLFDPGGIGLYKHRGLYKYIGLNKEGEDVKFSLIEN